MMDILGCLVVRPDCSLLAKYVNAPDTEEFLDLEAIVRVAVAVSELSRDDTEAFLCIKSISVAVAPGHGFLALVLASHDICRVNLALRARQMGHWFQLLRKQEVTGSCEDRTVGCEEDHGDAEEDANLNRSWLAGVMSESPYQEVWMDPLRRIPNLVAGAMLDFTLGSSPVLIVHGEESGISGGWDGYKWLPKWFALWEAVAAECKCLAHKRQARRVARRSYRTAGADTQESQATPKSAVKKVNQAHMTVLQTVVNVYIKLVRLPEHDPCIVAICCDNAVGQCLDAFEDMLPNNLGSEKAHVVKHSDVEFPAEVQSALSSVSHEMKRSFPRTNSLEVTGCKYSDEKSPQPILYPTPPSGAKESSSPRASMQKTSLPCSLQQYKEDFLPELENGGQLENIGGAADIRDTDSCLGSVDMLLRELCTEEDL